VSYLKIKSLLLSFRLLSFILYCSLCFGFFYNDAQRSSIRAVADFKAITCPPPQKFIKCTDLRFTTSPTIALIHCWAIVLLFRPCVGSDTLIDKLWLVRLACAAWQCVWLLSIGLFITSSKLSACVFLPFVPKSRYSNP